MSRASVSAVRFFMAVLGEKVEEFGFCVWRG
jgi:hypothetical protein